MSKNNVIEFEGREASTDPLNERLQAGAQKLIHQAVEAERYAQLEQYADRRTEAGHAGVVRNGYQPERKIQTGIRPVTVKIPKVRAKSGVRESTQRWHWYRRMCAKPNPWKWHCPGCI